MKSRREINLKIDDSCKASSLVCTKRKLLICSQLQRVEYDFLKIFSNIIVECRVISFLLSFFAITQKVFELGGSNFLSFPFNTLLKAKRWAFIPTASVLRHTA